MYHRLDNGLITEEFFDGYIHENLCFVLMLTNWLFNYACTIS